MPIEWLPAALRAIAEALKFSRQLEPIPEKQDEFVQEHASLLAGALSLYRRIDDMDLGETKRAAASVMKSINGVFFACHRPGTRQATSDLRMNSCYMFPVVKSDLSPGLLRKLRFAHPERDNPRLSAVLELAGWAEEVPMLPHELVLPVIGTPAEVLVGAPRAFMTNSPSGVDDTLKPKVRPSWKPWQKRGPATPGRFYLPEELDAGVRHEVIDYFDTNRELLRSFVSIPLAVPENERDKLPPEYRTIPLAVLSVQSNRTGVWSPKGKSRKYLLACILPLTAILASYLSKIRAIEASR